MRAKTAILVALLILVPAFFFPGCGGKEPRGDEEEVVNYAIESILIPKEGDAAFIVEWMRKAEGTGETDPMKLGKRFWKWEGGALSEISGEEYQELAAQRIGGDNDKWAYSQHSITVLELDEAAGKAVVEIGSLYNTLSGAGIRYRLNREGDEWKEVSEQTVWSS